MNLFTSKVPVPEREREREREGKKIFEFSGSWQFSDIDRCEKGENIDEKKRKKYRRDIWKRNRDTIFTIARDSALS